VIVEPCLVSQTKKVAGQFLSVRKAVVLPLLQVLRDYP